MLSFFLTAFLALSAWASDPYYDRLLADGKLDVTVALGFAQYEPDAPVSATLFNGVFHISTAAWPNGEVMDAFVRATEREFLENCDECGFSLAASWPGYRLFVSEMSYGGRKIPVRVKMIFPQHGVDLDWLRSVFIWGLGHDEVVFYLGHARDGRGFPDFASPHSDRGKIFYRDEYKGWTGFEKGYFARSKYQILMLNSCKSFQYYRDPIRKLVWEKEPSKLALILNRVKDMPFSDYQPTTLALIGGLMRKLPRQELLDSLENEAQAFHDLFKNDTDRIFVPDGFFDETYAKKASPKKREPNWEPWYGMPF